MFESSSSRNPTQGDSALVLECLGHLSVLEATDESADLAMLRSLETLKCAAEAAQARIAAGLAGRAEADGESTTLLAGKVARARKVSPHRGRRLLSMARVLHEVPSTAEAFRQGKISEWRASIVLRETSMLELADRQQIDHELSCPCGESDDAPTRLEVLGDRALAVEVASAAARLDPASVVKRRQQAEQDRCVTLRPAPDTMTYLTALLPVAQGVAAYAALTASADAARAAGDDRGRGQVMADTLVERVTGQASADAIPVAVQVVLSDRALVTGVDDDAQLHAAAAHERIPAELARTLIASSLSGAAKTSLRRLYAAPEGLVAMESRSRHFPAGLAELIKVRDQRCRTPWCDAPIRHIDHIEPHARGGGTTFINGQGLCEACNQAKADAMRWSSSDPPRCPNPWTDGLEIRVDWTMRAA